MDIRKIKKLIELIEGTGIAEIEIREADESVRISRYSSSMPVTVSSMPMQQMLPQPVYSQLTDSATLTSPLSSSTQSNVESQKGKTITSPMVGTFYRASSPTTKPFVEEGQAFSEGDTLCIIEAMKILNQITAERAGVILRVLVENGSPVEYGEPLFMIE